MNEILYANIITIVSVITGITSIGITLFKIYILKNKEIRMLQKINTHDFNKVIKSNEIQQLGSYLEYNLGNVTMYSYSNNKYIKRKVNNHIQEILLFIGTNEEVSHGKIWETDEADVKLFDPGIPSDIDPIIQEFNKGLIWNSLAKLRTLIEETLNSFLHEQENKKYEFKSAINLLYNIKEKKNISTSAFNHLQYSIEICNKVIHGYEVNNTEIIRAINFGVLGIKEIRNL